MKIKIYTVLFSLFVFFSAGYSQGEWELLFPSPTTNQMVGMYFIDSQTGWSVGEYGTILKTTDCGEDWTIQEIPWLFDLCDVHFPTALIGYAIGTNGFIIKTTDGGNSWNKLENKYSNNLNRVLFRDENNGWTIGEKGLILHTSNGGETWTLHPTNSPYTKLHGIDLIGTDGVIIVGEQETILITNDEGQNWQPVSWDSSEFKTYSFEDVYFVDELHGWIGGGVGLYTTLLATVDGGQTWTWIEQSGGRIGEFGWIDFDPYLGPLQQIYFFDDMKTGIGLFKACHLRDYGNFPMKTSDGGQNWSAVIYGHSEQYDGKGRFCVLDDNQIVCTGYHGDFRYSTDKGKEWHLSAEEQRWWQDLTVVDNGQLLLHKYFMRHNVPDGDIDQSARSSDYGTTWSDFEPAYLDSNGQTLSIDYFNGYTRRTGDFVNNRDTLWVLMSLRKPGETGHTSVFFSVDFGYTYKEVNRTAMNSSFSTFITPDTLISYNIDVYETAPNLYTPLFRVRYSFDRGVTVNTFESTELWNVFGNDLLDWLDWSINGHHFFNGRKGFLVGTDGNIVKTEDITQNWENIYSGVVEDLHDITFIDEQTGFVVGDFGRILKTDDGGMAWRKTDSGTQDDVLSIGFINDHEGWVGTENGLRYTTNAGETWQGVPLRYAHGKYENLVFDEAGNGYAYTLTSLGHSGYLEAPCSHIQVLRMRNDANGIYDYNSEKSVPDAIELYNNYPNPFNASTRIDYYLPRSGVVSLKIYNIQGQLVRTLMNQSLSSGRHSTIWDGYSDSGTSVSSGMYIYQLQCNGQIKNHKLLLLK
jgi:photosystem II stability/assembly factor-like uncharacterized protein